MLIWLCIFTVTFIMSGIMIFQPTIITCRKTELCFLSPNLEVHESCISCGKDIFKDFHILGANIVDRALCMPFVFEDCCIRPFQLFGWSQRKRRSRKFYSNRKKTKVWKDTMKLIKPRGRSTISKNLANKQIYFLI